MSKLNGAVSNPHQLGRFSELRCVTGYRSARVHKAALYTKNGQSQSVCTTVPSCFTVIEANRPLMSVTMRNVPVVLAHGIADTQLHVNYRCQHCLWGHAESSAYTSGPALQP